MTYPKNDQQFTETKIASLKTVDSGVELTFEDGWSMFVTDPMPVEPKEGMTLRLYGKGIGFQVRGLFIDGRKVYYRTASEQEKATEDALYGSDNSEVLRRWDDGESVFSISMGGFGPGYEQALQICAMETLRLMARKPPIFEALDSGDEDYWKSYREEITKLLFAENAPCTKLGLSGAQVGAALQLALMFMRHGPAGVAKKADDRRRIQISRHFPDVYGDHPND